MDVVQQRQRASEPGQAVEAEARAEAEEGAHREGAPEAQEVQDREPRGMAWKRESRDLHTPYTLY